MNNYYLDFEKPIKEIDEHILGLEAGKDLSKDDLRTLAQLKEERAALIQEIYSGLSRWQRIQLARHPDRPYSLDYIHYFAPDFIELHGDKAFADDHAVIAGIGTIGTHRVAIIGQQKGRNTKENLHRNFGMMKPEGYRKALRVMKMAEKFNLPIVTLIDTPGADPGIAAEERGQGYAIANNLIEMASIDTQILSIVIGEGASGGALGIGVGDKILMLNNAWYSVISPENCSTILWRSWDYKETAADSLKLTATDMQGLGLVDEIIEEPLGGAHTFPKETYKKVKKSITKAINEFIELDKGTLVKNRMEKFSNMGMVKE